MKQLSLPPICWPVLVLALAQFPAALGLSASRTVHQIDGQATVPGQIANSIPKVIPWLVVDGGIHGVHIAARLIGDNKVAAQDICIVDDHEKLLQAWKTRTSNTGMKFLRSSAGYHLDLEETPYVWRVTKRMAVSRLAKRVRRGEN